MTDSIRLLTENVAKITGGSLIKQRYIDIIDDKKSAKIEQSGEKIVVDIAKRAGLEIK